MKWTYFKETEKARRLGGGLDGRRRGRRRQTGGEGGVVEVFALPYQRRRQKGRQQRFAGPRP